MSQRDKSPSQTTQKVPLDDKITKILQTHGSLSSSLITKQINEKYKVRYNRKSIQRHLNGMITEGSVIQNPAIGREQTYSLSQKPRPLSEFYINQFWKNLDIIRRINVENSFKAFRELRSLCKTWTLLYKELKPKFRKVESVLVKYLKRGYDENMPSTEGYCSIPQKQLKGLPEIEDLIGKVAEFLHDQFEKLSSERVVSDRRNQ